MVVGEKNVNVEVDEALWGRVKALAAMSQRPVKKVVENALRLVLADRDGSVGRVTPEEPPAAERGEPSALEALKRAGLVTSGRAWLVEDPRHALDTVTRTEGDRGQREDLARALDPRETERRRRAAQDRLRTHPEDEVADPEVDF